MANRIEIFTKVNDTRSVVMKKKLCSLGFEISEAAVVEVYTINKNFAKTDLEKIAEMLANPVSQKYSIDVPVKNTGFNFAIETGFLPGVTDNIGNTAKESIEDLLKTKFQKNESVHSSTLILVEGHITKNDAEKIGQELANSLIQRIYVKTSTEFKRDNGMNTIVPTVTLSSHPQADEVNLDIPENELIKMGKEGILDKDGSRRGPLALEKEYLTAIKKYFEKKGRKPTDIELESLAQSWSEHCKHTIFAAKIDNIKNGLYKGYIKKATEEIRKKKGKKDFCVSVFKDNSGGIIFDDKWIITDKAETHNTPSALDPFGGAITGIVGVNRDTVGFGKGAKPIINKYGFCVGNPDDKVVIYRDREAQRPALLPRRILDGVVDGVNSGGNCSGIPTPQGFVYFNDGYKGKPLIFVGTIGLIPRKINGKPAWEKSAKNGDKIVMVGGRVGQDGIHGATFSSEVLSPGSPATAVQIGDPITQKKFSDAIIKEARKQNLYNSITDNGAGGLSCSVSEMARECGGCEVELDKVPLKYPNLEPWKIWISESQERMTLSIPPEKVNKFIRLMEKRGVEATAIGTFNNSGKCMVKYNGKTIMNLDMKFLHDGLPEKKLKTIYKKTHHSEPKIKQPKDLTNTLLEMMARPNICSYEYISRQYDHMVQGGAVLGPLQGKGEVNTTTSVTKPFPESTKAIICSQGLNPTYSSIDTYHMAACAIDTAIRNALAAGANLSHLALMDNFCWCSSNDPQRLGQLKAAVKACYDYATFYGTPFISGKDSMFNDFSGYDALGKPIKISVPPTLLVSSISVIGDATKSVSLDPKYAGDLVYVLGETKNELGGSEYFASIGAIGNEVPKVDAKKAKKLYQKLQEAIDKRLIASAFSPSLGGLGVALAKKAVAGQLGIEVDLTKLPKTKDVIREDSALFSESQSRFVVTVAPHNKEKFALLFKGIPFAQIGKVTEKEIFEIKGLSGKTVIKTDIKALNKYYRKTFANY